MRVLLSTDHVSGHGRDVLEFPEDSLYSEAGGREHGPLGGAAHLGHNAKVTVLLDFQLNLVQAAT